ncbi:MAG: ATP-grasp domain-containing protein [Rhizobiaceae bacterium]|nr:ATP-grasp domain-containing protein [Rhizobiaceae bacterium]
MIKSLLIANRGEIACRIIKTAKRMGVRTIAVYSQADADALHVRLADEAHLIGGAAASDSYLRSGRILSVAKEAGADAVHPGYGFLSENADFAELTADAGMIFVGPPPSAIREMGLKDRAKEIMVKADVPVVPGYHGNNQSPSFLKRKAYEIGYPVLIKAVAGGGGKGMRKVGKALEFDEALEAAKREAMAAFGNDVVLIEKFVESPRHIEIQVFADGHGNVVHLFERDCSLQRRHQKVIEEAPAPGMSAEVRAAMGAAACEAARAVGYQGAGTVEFIADGAGGLSEDGFYFMEMNTRLQVEHPVTEMITGLDLVEWQLRVASGEELPVKQDDLTLTGHAVEARIYAEDPNAGFLPSTGKLVAMDLGGVSDQIRVDSGVEQGDVISPHYDPMIAKLIVHGATRDEALESLEGRLRAAQIAGPVTNTAFLANLCADPTFKNGHFDTSLIDTKLDDLISTKPIEAATVCAGVSGLIERQRARIEAENRGEQLSPWQAADGFQLVGQRELDWQFTLDGERLSARVRFGADGIEMSDGKDGWTKKSNTATVYEDGGQLFVLDDGRQSIFEETVQQAGDVDGAGASDGRIVVPMHGKIIAVTVSEGDSVEQGDLLFSVEAMKMEHAVLAPSDGTVSELAITAGEQVENGFPAMILVAENESD